MPILLLLVIPLLIDSAFASDFDVILQRAEQGEASAQYDLGNMYYHGKNVTQDFKRAAVWYQKASVQGHTSAQYKLADMYYSGVGVEKDYSMCRILAASAASKGHSHALSLRKLCAKMMTSF